MAPRSWKDTLKDILGEVDLKSTAKSFENHQKTEFDGRNGALPIWARKTQKLDYSVTDYPPRNRGPKCLLLRINSHKQNIGKGYIVQFQWFSSSFFVSLSSLHISMLSIVLKAIHPGSLKRKFPVAQSSIAMKNWAWTCSRIRSSAITTRSWKVRPN